MNRYADLVVHRLLAIAIEVEAPNQKILNSQRIHSVCENINIRHRMAQYASRASYNIHKCVSKIILQSQEYFWLEIVKLIVEIFIR